MIRIPQIKFISGIDRSIRSTITTQRPHNYVSGDILHVIIEKDYGCAINENTIIEVIDEKNFRTNIDTSQLPEFKPFSFHLRALQTPPQCIPIFLK